MDDRQNPSSADGSPDDVARAVRESFKDAGGPSNGINDQRQQQQQYGRMRHMASQNKTPVSLSNDDFDKMFGAGDGEGL